MLFERHQKFIQKILAELDKHPLRYKQLVQLWVELGSNPVQFVRCMQWMKEKGYVKKSDVTNRNSPYEITEAGKKYLEGLKA